MKKISCSLFSTVIAIAYVSAVIAQNAAAKSQPLGEEAAVDLLLRTIKKDHVYDKRIALNCVTLTTEETTRIYFEIALRENHTAKCGGDPDLAPVVDRYRVNRATGKIELYDAAGDQWRVYHGMRRQAH